MTHPNPDNRSQAEKNADPNYNQTEAQKAEAARLKKIQDEKDAANR